MLYTIILWNFYFRWDNNHFNGKCEISVPMELTNILGVQIFCDRSTKIPQSYFSPYNERVIIFVHHELEHKAWNQHNSLPWESVLG